jgi:hypothetical protein
MKYIRLQKIRAADCPDAPPADPVTYKYGERCATGHSLPIEYELEGWLAEDPAVGKCVQVLRCARASVTSLGQFTSSEVTLVCEDGFHTRNSVYRLTERLTAKETNTS